MTNLTAARLPSVIAPDGDGSLRSLESQSPARSGRFVRREDRELVRSVRAGDDRAFELVYERYQRRIGAYVHGMVRDHGRAEDVTQEVFISALRRLRASEQPIVLRPWLYEIARNACIDHFRRAQRSQEVFYERDPHEAERVLAGVPAPEEAVDTKQKLDHLRDALSGLSDVQRDVLVMRELEGLSYRDIGRRLHLSRPAVESALFRARRRLGHEYEQLSSGARCVHVQQAVLADRSPGASTHDRALVAAHLSRCPACRRQTRLALLDRRGLTSRLGALLPLQALPRWVRELRAGARSAPLAGARTVQIGGWPAMLTRAAEPAVGLLTAGAAVMALATLGPATGTPRPPALRHGHATSATTGVRPSSSPGVGHAAPLLALESTSASLAGWRPPATLVTRWLASSPPLGPAPSRASASSGASSVGALAVGGYAASPQTATTPAPKGAGVASAPTADAFVPVALPAHREVLRRGRVALLVPRYRSSPLATVASATVGRRRSDRSEAPLGALAGAPASGLDTPGAPARSAATSPIAQRPAATAQGAGDAPSGG